MFDSIILVTGPVEQTMLAGVLRQHNPQLTIHPITAAADFASFDLAALARSRLIAFATPLVVPPNVLKGLGFEAYNFHPVRRAIPAGRRHISRSTSGPANSA